MFLYPHLLNAEASDLARNRAALSIDEAKKRSSTSHPSTLYSPTGGTRVQAPHLADLQRTVRGIASSTGYPSGLDLERQQRFDAEAAAALKSKMRISASEASHTGVWSFMACVLLPDVVRWRYPGGETGTTLERFIGGSRGIRNTFGRLWWRAHLLGLEDDFSLVQRLGEDELVQITERPVLAGNPHVAREFARRFLDHATEFEELSRSDLMRDAIKRLRRLLSFLALEILTPGQLLEVIDGVLGDAAVALGVGLERVSSVPGHRQLERNTTVVRDESTAGAGDPLLDIVPDTADDLAVELHRLDPEVIDKRDSGGCLWVVDQLGLEPLMDRLAEYGYPFSFAKNGSRSTDHRAAWYLPHHLGGEDGDTDGGEGQDQTSDDDPAGDEGPSSDSPLDLRHMDLWERGEIKGSNLKADFVVSVAEKFVRVSPNGGGMWTIEWPIGEAGEDLRTGLRNLTRVGSERTLLAIVAAVFVRQEEFLEEGLVSLNALTLSQVADDLGTHESTISRAKSDVHVETPSGLLPLGFFFSAGIPHNSGRVFSARAIRARLRKIIESESPENPLTDDELVGRLKSQGFSIARRTIAKYRDILGIPSTEGRSKKTE